MVVLFLRRAVVLAAVVAGLVLPCITPEVSNITVIAAQIAAILLTFPWSGWRAMIRRPAVGMPLLGCLLLVIAFTVNAKSPTDVGMIGVFLPLLLIGPLLAVFGRSVQAISPGQVGGLALLGATLGLAIALFDSLVMHQPRAGILVNNPIHFADICLAVGSFALVGLFATSPWRWLCLLGPIFGLVSVFLSGSRGPFVAALVLLIFLLAAVFIWGQFSRRLSIGIAALATASIVLVIALGSALNWAPVTGLTTSLGSLLGPGGFTLASDVERVNMYRAAYEAFLASPIFGHGLTDFTRIAASYLPGVDVPIYQHLHNDIADFGVIGGIFGLVAYALILLAPLVDALSAPAGRTRQPALFAAGLLVIGYFAMGLTNATFGILSLTVLFALSTVVVGHLSRPARAP